MEPLTVSVTQLNEYVKSLLGADPLLNSICVHGELTGFKRHSSGHLYFGLKDESGYLRCVMFKGQAIHAPAGLQDGVHVQVTGQVSLYTRDGQYQLYARTLRLEGAGQLYLAFEALKAKLLAEGLFDQARKRPLPFFPQKVGVVTSPTGAALQDILRVAHARNPAVGICISPALVQGVEAAASIERALERLADKGVDVILLGRGGGSIEELWAFNEERVARAIGACPVPVVSCVGHESDFTIADFVADVRAATPTHGVELVIPERSVLLHMKNQALERMRRALASASRSRREELRSKGRRLRSLHPLARLAADRARSRAALRTVERYIRYTMDEVRMRLASAQGRLTALSPMRVLSRGYALVEQNHHVIGDSRQLAQGDEIHIRLGQGALDAQILRVYPKEEGQIHGNAQEDA